MANYNHFAIAFLRIKSIKKENANHICVLFFMINKFVDFYAFLHQRTVITGVISLTTIKTIHKTLKLNPIAFISAISAFALVARIEFTVKNITVAIVSIILIIKNAYAPSILILKICARPKIAAMLKHAYKNPGIPFTKINSPTTLKELNTISVHNQIFNDLLN